MIEYQIEFWKHLAVDAISDDSCYVFSTGLQSPLINLLIFKKQDIKDITPIIDKATRFFAEHKNIPWGINIVDDEYSSNIKNILLEMGFQNICQQYEIDTEIKQINTSNLSEKDIIEVSDADMLDDWVIPITSAFEAAAQDSKLYLDLSKKAFSSNSNRLKHFILYENDKPISSATLCFFDKIARLDNVATLKEKQGLGYGKKIVQYCTNKSKLAGSNRMVFESSKQGIKLYRKLGFSETGKSYIYSKFSLDE